ncbi:DUF397 domain-containing protein [Streptomyces sp. DSM 3412]|uniref:DUF397 domain-containing protein n=1 Tax=Streptomyces gottesmaniae TaxID=3075518 RepID=A0ABU2Z6J8_9ACTN|nr:DUF397 domain-containing protein [Streptomyces sp. DSM 3412]MDT0572197.1 DUF397 domain-containing protein [Streptomyces sp. DSM 3412]
MHTALDLRTATWRKSSYSGGTSAECVEVGGDFIGAALSWRKSSHSAGTSDECVEVADDLPGLVPVRDSKNPTGDVLVFQAAAWSSFVAAAREIRVAQ